MIMNKLLFAVLFLAVVGAFAVPSYVFEYERSEEIDEPDWSNWIRPLHKTNKKLHVQAFQWKNCGPSLAGITKLSVTPDPLTLPGDININATGVIQLDTLDSPVPASLIIQKKALGKWVKIPCIDNFGSCDYDDFCDILSGVGDCPDPIVTSGLGCNCPFKKGTYNVNGLDINIPYGFISGDYNVTGTLHYNGQYVACLEVILTISS